MGVEGGMEVTQELPIAYVWVRLGSQTPHEVLFNPDMSGAELLCVFFSGFESNLFCRADSMSGMVVL